MSHSVATLHLLFISLWGGVLLAEFVIELAARERAEIYFTATLHFWIDLLFELPLILGILITGAVLTYPLFPLSTLLLVKIVSGLIALAMNLVCVVLVILRYRRRNDAGLLLQTHRRIRLTALGLPFGILAAYLGFAYFL